MGKADLGEEVGSAQVRSSLPKTSQGAGAALADLINAIESKTSVRLHQDRQRGVSQLEQLLDNNQLRTRERQLCKRFENQCEASCCGSFRRVYFFGDKVIKLPNPIPPEAGVDYFSLPLAGVTAQYVEAALAERTDLPVPVANTALLHSSEGLPVLIMDRVEPLELKTKRGSTWQSPPLPQRIPDYLFHDKNMIGPNPALPLSYADFLGNSERYAQLGKRDGKVLVFDAGDYWLENKDTGEISFEPLLQMKGVPEFLLEQHSQLDKGLTFGY